MSMIFGWCQGSGHHDSCRKETGTTTGILRRGCQCHDGDSPVETGKPGAANGKPGAQHNGPERGVCTSGRGLTDAYEERQL